MNVAGTHRDAIAKQLEAYGESWRLEHEEVKRCWAFEDTLAVGLSLFKLINARHRTWHHRLITGLEKYDPADEEAIKDRYRWWLRPSDQVMERLNQLERDYPVEGAQEFRRYCREAQEILAHWRSPRLATPVALKELPLDPQEISGLRRMLDEANDTGRYPRPAQEMPTGDASLLR